MTTQSFLIGPIKDGLRKDVKPWATPEDSFETLENAYQFRGRILRRPGYTALNVADQVTRLSTDGGTTFLGLPVMGLKNRDLFGIGLQNLIGFDTQQAYLYNGTSFSILTSVMPVTWSGTNSQFFWTAQYAGAFWATNSKPGFHGWTVTLFAGSAGIGTLATVNVTAVGNTAAVGDTVYFLNITGPAAPNNLVFAVVTVSGDPVLKVRAINVPATFTWTNGAASTGSMLDNIKSIAGQDGIRYYATTSLGNTWVNYNPPLNSTDVLVGALLIFPYRGYLVFLNTTEGNESGVQNFPNRARWTQIGTPYYSEPVPVTPATQTVDPLSVRDDIFGRGGANDAPTNDVIVGAGFIRDILVVYFQKSTWRLRFVNNSQNPFVWERVNIELGCSSTFSTITFDKGLMGIGTRGIVISDANDTIRFDEKIPDDIFQIRQAHDGLQRVYGIRTFRTRLLYWTYPDNTNPDGIFPDKVLVFNYDTKNWSYFDDTFTCFGYNYGATIGYIWDDLTKPWSSYNNITWNSGVTEKGYETVIAGNQQGYVFSLEQTSGTNSPSLFISNIGVGITSGIITSPDHNLKTDMWIKITDVLVSTSSDGVSLNGRNFQVFAIDANNFGISEFSRIDGPNAVGTSFPTTGSYFISYVPIIPGSVQINIGALVFKDTNLDGNLLSTGSNSGFINYQTGELTLNFNPGIASTPIYIRVVSYNPDQLIVPVPTIGIYGGSGQITKISNFDIESKIFNFFKDDKRSRLSKIDFYVDTTKNGQFICNVFADSSDTIINAPLPDNGQSNVVLTSVNPYQVGDGDQTIYRLYADSWAQTIQLEFLMSDQQMAVDAINSEDMQLSALMVTLKRGGRLP